ncbi:MAG: IS200/IS605 family element transposase accessory protein TnpB [Moorea sp. SIO3I7]|uniref:RNA-guided endonuclease InsQ/TnpB family protein n=1 Tax=unclassified Moorena TaxID=2683338 RepID=UPI0013C06539|nr:MULTISPECIES: transposase [unclassified Moorena]NEO01151.1 IS200/IS605 family element transposase accessory protein TnpB [Moorena sp. SIO3I7]NEO08968.1 IS200/IS605 family element transposase accessory protein TnpB [Moorena sp. SIO3I8]NEO23512.1 IS200/IS605 family element transposase accessory protein TnpB [Moorena sp. SIO4A5]NEP25672.1 IS200/IS605 family element transposase accessory protein TnpB [Moorena sp. SIO3I6]NEQ61170.1 IS200/IS605 family element transposase accessory protein TnpB [M
MIVYEMKLQGTQAQYRRLDEAIRTGRFVRNSIIRAWMDGDVKNRNDAYSYCKVLSDNPEFPWVSRLNSMARQAHAERAWASIERFYRNCRQKVPGKKGFPRFKKSQIRASVEYKTTGWKLSEDRRYLTFSDKFQAGKFKLWGSRDLHFYQLKQIKRVRVIRRHDGYYAQFLIDHTREENKELTGKQTGLDVGLNFFYTDCSGEQIDNPRFLRKDEAKIKKLQRRLSRTQKGSQNRKKAINRLGRAHLKVSRRRNDWVCKLAQHVIQSNDLVAIENLRIKNLVKNHKLAKSINDAAWYKFREWLEYFGRVYGVPVIAVDPAYTSTDCSNCGEKVVKTLSTRTHRCPHCCYRADRDKNAAINILKSALKQLSNTVGQTEINASGEIDLCLKGETQLSKSARRKRKPKQ